MMLRTAAASLRPVTTDDVTLDAVIYVDERALLTIMKPLSISHTLMNPTRRTPDDNVWVPVLPHMDTRYGRAVRARIYDLENMTYTDEPLDRSLPLLPERTFTGEADEIRAFIAHTYGMFSRYVPEPEPQRAKPLI